MKEKIQQLIEEWKAEWQGINSRLPHGDIHATRDVYLQGHADNLDKRIGQLKQLLEE